MSAANATSKLPPPRHRIAAERESIMLSAAHGIPPSHPDHFAGSPYHYVPTLYVCAIFIALFGLSGRA